MHPCYEIRAPSRIRTDTGRCLRPLPLPLGYRGDVKQATPSHLRPQSRFTGNLEVITSDHSAPSSLITCLHSPSPDRGHNDQAWVGLGQTTTAGNLYKKPQK